MSDSTLPGEAGAKLSLDLALLLRDGDPEYRRLLGELDSAGSSADLRAAAAGLARRISAYGRLADIQASAISAMAPEVSPQAALTVLRQIAYACVALTAEDPDRRTLLSEDELDEMLRERGADAWLERLLQMVPEGKAAR